MDKTRLSIDSLGESELDRLKDILKQKETIIAEKSEIINSLRQQVADLKEELEETDNNQQVYHQKIDRLTKELEEKNEHLEAVSHSLSEVETAHDNLNKKYEARVGQVKGLFEDLKKAKKDLEKLESLNEELRHNNERLTVELEMANTRKRVWLDEEEEEQARNRRLKATESKLKENHTFNRPEPSNQNYSHQPRDIRCHQQQHLRQQFFQGKMPNSENQPPQLTSALHFAMADEVGEIMDSSSALPLTPSTVNRPRQRQALMQPTVTTVSKATIKASDVDQLNGPVASLEIDDQNLYTGYTNNFQHNEIMSRNNNNSAPKQYCPKHQPATKTVEVEKTLDPIEEYKLRVARANELARRNKLTKPLHQTSYALELDTFDTTNLTEQEIKRGNVAKAAAAAASAAVIKRQQSVPASSTQSQSAYSYHQDYSNQDQHQYKHVRQQHHQQQQRQALMDRANTTPVAKRVYKKAEAFIV